MSPVPTLAQRCSLRLGTALLLAPLWGCTGVIGGAGGGDAAGGSGGGGGTAAGAPGAQLDCPPGDLALGDGSCQPPGVPEDGCGQGFEPDDDLGCIPVLPPASCEAGAMAVPGEAECRPVAPCGLGRWSNIPAEADTQFVDGTYGSGNSDGTQDRPWRTIQEGVAAAAAGAIVAVAPFLYSESLLIDRPVRLWGTCPATVLIDGMGLAAPTVTITAGGAGAELHALGITSVDVGVLVDGAASVLLEQLWIHQTGSYGVSQIGTMASTTLRSSLLEATTSFALLSTGGALAVEQTVVRSTAPDGVGDFGLGILVRHDGQQRPSLTVRASLLEDNASAAVLVAGGDALVEDSYVHDTQPQASDLTAGQGLAAYEHQLYGEPARLTVRGSVVERSRDCGVCIIDSDLDLDHSVVLHTDAALDTSEGGEGVRVVGTADAATARPRAALRRSLLLENVMAGLVGMGAEIDAESLIIRKTHTRRSDDLFGRGVHLQPSEQAEVPSRLTMRGGLVDDNRECGIAVLGSELTMEYTAVLHTLPRPLDAQLGVGVALQLDPTTLATASGTVRQSVVDDAYVAGFLLAGAQASLEHVLVHDIQRQPQDDDFGDGLAVTAYIPGSESFTTTAAELRHLTVSRCVRSGVASFAASASIEQSVLDCNGAQLAGETIDGTPYQLELLGENLCQCNDQVVHCAVLSTGLEPPELISR